MDLLEVFEKAVNNLEQQSSLSSHELLLGASAVSVVQNVISDGTGNINIIINGQKNSEILDAVIGDKDTKLNLSCWLEKVNACATRDEVLSVVDDFRDVSDWTDGDRATMSRVYVRQLEGMPVTGEDSERFSPATIAKFYPNDMPLIEAQDFLIKLKKLDYSEQSFYWQRVSSWASEFPDEKWARRQFELLCKILKTGL